MGSAALVATLVIVHDVVALAIAVPGALPGTMGAALGGAVPGVGICPRAAAAALSSSGISQVVSCVAVL